jgi:hypothetical protein
MDIRNKKLTVSEARQLDMVDYLAGLTIEAKKIRGQNHWYFSPFRDETEPSFKIDRRRNRWRDFGEFDGIDRGNLVDFGIKYFKCSVSEFLARLSDDFSLHQHQPELYRHANESRIDVVSERLLTAQPLLDYLASRGISTALAKAWCREVDYIIKGRQYFAIGFKNNSGGYELRSANYRLSNSPKDLTIIASPNAKTVTVFEGFIDFLSYLSLPGSRAIQPSSYVVLNSLSFFKKARSFLEQHQSIKLYLDQDNSGIKCTQYALSISKKYHDESGLYKGHKDLNEYLAQLKQLPKPQLKQKL